MSIGDSASPKIRIGKAGLRRNGGAKAKYSFHPYSHVNGSVVFKGEEPYFQPRDSNLRSNLPPVRIPGDDEITLKTRSGWRRYQVQL